MLRRILFIGVAAAVVWGGAQADAAQWGAPTQSDKAVKTPRYEDTKIRESDKYANSGRWLLSGKDNW